MNCDNEVCIADSSELSKPPNPSVDSIDDGPEELEDETSDLEVDEIAKVLPSFKETYDAISIVEAMADLDIDKNSKLLIALDNFKSELVKKKIDSKTQSKINDYFSKK